MDLAARLAAAADSFSDPTDSQREALRAELRPVIEQAQRDLGLALAQLDGPDPEAALAALSLAVESVAACPSLPE